MAVDAASIVGATTNVTEAASLVGADVVYVSTDAVFSGDGRPRDEGAEPDPIMGLRAVEGGGGEGGPAGIDRGPPSFGCRSSSRSTPRTVSSRGSVRELAKASPRRGSTTRSGNPPWPRTSLRASGGSPCWPADQRSGTWQLPGSESLSRYEIARRVTDALQLDPSSVVSVPAPRDGTRPRHLDLRSDRARDEIGWEPARILR